MVGFPSPFSNAGSETLDPEDTFEAAHLPEPGPFLAEERVLTDEEHCAFHATTRELFEERGVYDVTFGYNLADLNRDARHPDAGYRYAEEAERVGDDAGIDDDDEAVVLRAEFTPTTPFCPQSEALTVGSFRAWNGLRDRHGYDLVRVRVAPSHQESAAINGRLEALESTFRETGRIPSPNDATGEAPGNGESEALDDPPSLDRSLDRKG